MGNDLPSAPRRYLRIERRGDYTIATVLESKIVTEALIQEFGDELYRVAEDPAISTLIMDCKRLHYLSSAGMGKFINTKKKLGRGRALVLCGIHPDLREVFRVTRLDNVFPIAPTLDLALAFLEETILLSCPMPDCDGWASVWCSATSLKDIFQCAMCHARYDGHPIDSDGPVGERIGVSWIEFETYEKERVRLHPRQDRISVLGRLDLFAMGAIERALQALPAPRPVLFDLEGVSELSQAGADALFEWFTGHQGDTAIFFVAERNTQVRQALGPSFRVYTDSERSRQAHGSLCKGRGATWSPTIAYRREDHNPSTDRGAGVQVS